MPRGRGIVPRHRTWLNGPPGEVPADPGGSRRSSPPASPGPAGVGRGSRRDGERYIRVVDVVLVEVDVVFVELVLTEVLVVVTSQATAWSSSAAQSPHASQSLR